MSIQATQSVTTIGGFPYTHYVGTKEQLIDAGLAGLDMFPESGPSVWGPATADRQEYILSRRAASDVWDLYYHHQACIEQLRQVCQLAF